MFVYSSKFSHLFPIHLVFLSLALSFSFFYLIVLVLALLRWLTTVLMEYKGTTFNSFKKRFQAVFPFTIYCLLKSFTFLCEI